MAVSQSRHLDEAAKTFHFEKFVGILGDLSKLQNRKAIKANYFSPSLFEQFSPLSVNQARQTIFRTVINNTVKCRILDGR